MIKKLIIGAMMLNCSAVAYAKIKEQTKEKWKKNRLEVGYQSFKFFNVYGQ